MILYSSEELDNFFIYYSGKDPFIDWFIQKNNYFPVVYGDFRIFNKKFLKKKFVIRSWAETKKDWTKIWNEDSNNGWNNYYNKMKKEWRKIK